ncbi:hypothetical protein PoB_006615000 [Plakobranchus ocellatus]|uniref:DUF202 domain-containing protein n=1 Tax=Plakobranchus ocellatus TaxID=259542 RepID=A0AAV4D6N0_9GAST|nr:hypothetical protein PoB_006615000 [Plakobranchus ocellatus]
MMLGKNEKSSVKEDIEAEKRNTLNWLTLLRTASRLTVVMHLRADYLQRRWNYLCPTSSIIEARHLITVPVSLRRRCIINARLPRRRPQQGDLRLSGPPSGQGTSGGARTRDRRVPAVLRADPLTTIPPTSPLTL